MAAAVINAACQHRFIDTPEFAALCRGSDGSAFTRERMLTPRVVAMAALCSPNVAEDCDAWLLAADCALLGAALLGAEADLGTAVLQGLFGGLGFLLAMVLMAGVEDRISTSNVPRAMRGLPISLISASLIALAFMGFMGLGA